MVRPCRDLFFISFLILFFELAAIRFFASTVVFLTFFTNIVLLACFLGMSIGLLSAKSRRDLAPLAPLICLLAVGAAVAAPWLYWHWADGITLSPGDQQA